VSLLFYMDTKCVYLRRCCIHPIFHQTLCQSYNEETLTLHHIPSQISTHWESLDCMQILWGYWVLGSPQSTRIHCCKPPKTIAPCHVEGVSTWTCHVFYLVRRKKFGRAKTPCILRPRRKCAWIMEMACLQQ
jgi:hypothetical protein